MYLTVYFCAIVLLFCPGRTKRSNAACKNTSMLTSNLSSTGAPTHAGVSAAVPPGPTDCTVVKNAGKNKSGIYRIWPMYEKCYGSFYVYCDMETAGGAWTVIQRRGDYKKPKDYFYRTWKEYQIGFGNLTQDFWLGDSFGSVSGMTFTTKDRDNDIVSGGNCAKLFKGGWWYSDCHGANLNGLYLNGVHESHADGIEWRSWKGYNYSLPEVEMKIHRI